LVAPLSKGNNVSLMTVPNANAATTRARAAVQNTPVTTVLAQKQPGLADLVDVLTKLGRSGSPQTGGITDTVETIKAVKDLRGLAPLGGGGDELGEVTSLLTSPTALDRGSRSTEKERDKDEPPKSRRNRMLTRTAMKLVEVLEPSPEPLHQRA